MKRQNYVGLVLRRRVIIFDTTRRQRQSTGFSLIARQGRGLGRTRYFRRDSVERRRRVVFARFEAGYSTTSMLDAIKKSSRYVHRLNVAEPEGALRRRLPAADSIPERTPLPA